jgi:large subunit ribosomal protein L24
MATKIRRGDEVVVLAGKDRGKRGKVQEVHPRTAAVVVAGVNTAKRHTKANPNKNVKGGIIEQLVPLSASKVMLLCPHCNKPARVGYRIDGDTKERFCKSCGQALATEGKD